VASAACGKGSARRCLASAPPGLVPHNCTEMTTRSLMSASPLPIPRRRRSHRLSLIPTSFLSCDGLAPLVHYLSVSGASVQAPCPWSAIPLANCLSDNSWGACWSLPARWFLSALVCSSSPGCCSPPWRAHLCSHAAKPCSTHCHGLKCG